MNCASLPPPLNPLNPMNPPNLTADFHSKRETCTTLTFGHRHYVYSAAHFVILSGVKCRMFENVKAEQ